MKREFPVELSKKCFIQERGENAFRKINESESSRARSGVQGSHSLGASEHKLKLRRFEGGTFSFILEELGKAYHLPKNTYSEMT